jgi:hypothetical protein
MFSEAKIRKAHWTRGLQPSLHHLADPSSEHSTFFQTCRRAVSWPQLPMDEYRQETVLNLEQPATILGGKRSMNTDFNLGNWVEQYLELPGVRIRGNNFLYLLPHGNCRQILDGRGRDQLEVAGVVFKHILEENISPIFFPKTIGVSNSQHVRTVFAQCGNYLRGRRRFRQYAKYAKAFLPVVGVCSN